MGMVLPVMGVVVLVAVLLLEGCTPGLADVPVPLPEPPLTQADKVAAIATGNNSFLNERIALREDFLLATIVIVLRRGIILRVASLSRQADINVVSQSVATRRILAHGASDVLAVPDKGTNLRDVWNRMVELRGRTVGVLQGR